MCPTMSEDTGANAENVCNVLTEFTIQSDTTPRLVRRFVRSRGAARSNSVDHSTCVLSMSSISNSTCCPLQPMIRRASFQVNRCQQARRPTPAWFVPNKIVHVLMLSFPMSLAFTSVLTAHIVTGFRNTKSRVSGLFNVSLPLLLRVPRLIVQSNTKLNRRWTKQKISCPLQSLVMKILSTQHVQEVLFSVIGSPALSASESPVMLFYSLHESLGSDAGIVRKRFKCRGPFKYISAFFLARVKSECVGDEGLYDTHIVTNRRSGLTPAMSCCLPTAALISAC